MLEADSFISEENSHMQAKSCFITLKMRTRAQLLKTTIQISTFSFSREGFKTISSFLSPSYGGRGWGEKTKREREGGRELPPLFYINK